MKSRNRFLAILVVGISTLVTLVNSTAIAVSDEDSSNGITFAREDIKSLKVRIANAQNKPLAGAKVFQNQVHILPLAPSVNKRTAIKNHKYVSDSAECSGDYEIG